MLDILPTHEGDTVPRGNAQGITILIGGKADGQATTVKVDIVHLGQTSIADQQQRIPCTSNEGAADGSSQYFGIVVRNQTQCASQRGTAQSASILEHRRNGAVSIIPEVGRVIIAYDRKGYVVEHRIDLLR
ncbi:hypothetical protein [Clostridium aceticum]|uniref:hypothetical protein n=1 Tax=Clostridium aceticum TaxID=84022 RepID=UPI001FA70E82|nr:hypothetical protein [Clostridium aceticum]